VGCQVPATFLICEGSRCPSIMMWPGMMLEPKGMVGCYLQHWCCVEDEGQTCAEVADVL